MGACCRTNGGLFKPPESRAVRVALLGAAKNEPDPPEAPPGVGSDGELTKRSPLGATTSVRGSGTLA